MNGDFSALDRYLTVSIGLTTAVGVALATNGCSWTNEEVGAVAAD